MSELPWIVGLIPQGILHFVVNLMILASLIGFGATFFLKTNILLSKYNLPLRVLSMLLLVFGVYLKGVLNQEDKWQARIKELEEKVAIAEKKSKETNIVIQEKIVTKIKKVKDTQYKIKEVIKEKEKIIDKECKVPKEAIDILNSAATGELPK